MTCKPDDKRVFETQQDYTEKCEACGFYAKIYHYRSCEDRHAWNAQNGQDVFGSIGQLDRLARIQQGLPSPGVSPVIQPRRSSGNSSHTIKSRRGRS